MLIRDIRMAAIVRSINISFVEMREKNCKRYVIIFNAIRLKNVT